MSSNSTSSSIASKGGNVSAQTPSPAQFQAPPSFSVDGHQQRRSGGSVTLGAGSAARASLSSARNNQSFRKQNKNQRRPRLADEDAAAESAAMNSTSSRKGQTSITHLMNFTLPPRPQYQPYANHGRNTRRNPTWGLGSGYHAVDKARYVHANYRFIVDPRGDYHAQAVDADVHLEWNTVLQILASAQSQSASCPICLSIPVAPRMAKCGHIFCLPCLIRYMHSTDDTKPIPEKRARWKKCPICFDSVYISDTRPVRWFIGREEEEPREGGDVILRLIMRQPGSTLALPRDGARSLAIAEDIPWYFPAEVTDYARVMKGSEDYMVSQFEGEIEELHRQELEDDIMFGEDSQWTRKAVAAIVEAKEKVKGIGNVPSALQQPAEKKVARPPINFNEPSEDVPDFYHIQHAAKPGQSSGGSATPQSQKVVPAAPDGSVDSSVVYEENVPGVQSRPPQPSAIASSLSQIRATVYIADHHPSGSPFYFYQALLHYYLSPLDIRILKAAFGDYSAFPAVILPRVEHVSTGHIVDDDLRKRAKYLAHLPHGCEVGFLECDWTDVVGPEILERFAAEIERRRQKNREKEVREEKERVRAEKEEDDKRWAAARRKRPTISRDLPPESNLQQDIPPVSAVDLSLASSSPPWSSSRTRTGSAFASLASPSTSPNAPRTVWGTTAVVPASPPLQAVAHEHELPENDGWLQGWERDLLGEDGLVARVGDCEIGEGGEKAGAGAAAAAAGKKKKGKKIMLMTTNARRGA
ncbi:ring finger domain protein [Lasallia pustulata]|uniref:Ring finger domain protein n=1 Tax=Lasallia pustulata TaxID=136370 RepID=A0A1W5CT08_9LECA|nr:ring finger domain protein [Lasallia pustulata]